VRWAPVALGALALAALDAVIGTQGQAEGSPAKIGGLLSSLATIPDRIINPSTTVFSSTSEGEGIEGSGAGEAASAAQSAYGTSAGGSAQAGQVLADAAGWAEAQVPYKWGGTSGVTGADCSGMVQTIFGDAGITLPRTTYQQVDIGTSIPVQGTTGLAQAQPGDLLFFDADGHVGIYAGDGEMFDEPHTGGHAEEVPVWGTPDAIRNPFTTTTTTTTTASAAPATITV
jgi:cell wall-associated NlpC family hydrolase